jgi:hypothetical protein
MHKMKITKFKTTSFQVKVLQKKFTMLHADFSKIVLKYNNELHLLRYLTPLRVWLHNCMASVAQLVRACRALLVRSNKFKLEISIYKTLQLNYFFYRLDQWNIPPSYYLIRFPSRSTNITRSIHIKSTRIILANTNR